MRWKGRRQSENVEDRRGMGGGGGAMLLGGGGIGTLVIVLIAAFMGVDPRPLLQQGGPGGGAAVAPGEPVELTPAEEEAGAFVKTIFADTEDVWTRIFAESGQTYELPTLVLFKQQVRSGCGVAGSETGPFYCPADQKVYLDPSFFVQLSQQLGAPGDFAQAYVVAHEVGHHVQNLLGYTQQVDKVRAAGASQLEVNQASIRLELQADFLAGVALHAADERYDTIQPGDVAEALNAAKMIGDDTLQRRATGTVKPHTFNHGTSEQRLRWLSAGLKGDDVDRMGELFELPMSQL